MYPSASHLSRNRLGILAIAVALCALSCGEASAPPPPLPVGLPGIQIVSGSNVTDTIDAKISDPLIVEVHDSTGALVPAGTEVRFEGVGFPGGYREIMVTPPDSSTPNYFEFITRKTDLKGRAAVSVQLGHAAKTNRLEVITLSDRVTVDYVTRPGAPHFLSLGPPDTAIYLNAGLTLRAALGDRNGNPRPEPLTFESSPPGVSVSNTRVVTASGVGRYTITASGGGKSASVRVSVVPSGRLVGVSVDQISPPRLFTADLDGSNLREISRSAAGFARWIPGTNKIIYTAFAVGPNHYYLRTADDSNAPVFSDFLASPPASLTSWDDGTPSADGQWVFFSGSDTQCGTATSCLYRAHADGTSPELLGLYIGKDILSSHPAPSPDGSKVAFVTGTDPVIKVLDIASKTVSAWSVAGQNPSWSPNGSSIVYNTPSGGPLRIVNADGTNARVLSSGVTPYVETLLSWSSDGQWVLARNAISVDYLGTINLIQVSTGLVLPIPQFAQVVYASLKP